MSTRYRRSDDDEWERQKEQKWPGFHADGEPARMEAERRREEEIRARNLSCRIQAQFTPDRIDPATGRTFRDGLVRGMYDDDQVIRGFREMTGRFRQDRERYRWAQVRIQGRRGRN